MSISKVSRALALSLLLSLFIFSLAPLSVYAGSASSSLVHYHRGNSASGGGCYSVPIYHSHSGNTTSGGACYSPVYHKHVQSCLKEATCIRTPVAFNLTSTEYITCSYHGTSTKATYKVTYEHSACGLAGSDETFIIPCTQCGGSSIYDRLPHTYSYQGCGKTTSTVESYKLSCPKSTSTIEGYNLGCGLNHGTTYGVVRFSSNTDSWTKGNVTLSGALDDSAGAVRAGGYGGMSFSTNGGHIASNSGSSIAVDANGTYYMQVNVNPNLFDTAAAGVMLTVSNIDKTAPTITGINCSNSGWVTSNTVSVSAADKQPGGSNGSGLHSSAYSFADNSWQSGNSFTFTDNGTYSVKVRDALDNVATSSVNITNIDTVPPTITSITYDAGNNWISSNTATILANDLQPNGSNGSGINSYSFNDGASWQSSNQYTFTDNGTYTLKVKDNSGKVSSRSITITNIDSVPPTVTEASYNNGSEWLENNTVHISAHDLQPNGSNGSGLASSAYSYDNGHSWESSNTHTYEDNATYEIQIRDNTSKVTTKSISINNIDNVPPTIASIDYNSGDDWLDENPVSVNANDSQPNGSSGSGLADEAYSFDDGESWQHENSFSYKDNAVYTIHVKDNTGKVTKSSISIQNIDNTPPTIESIDYDASDEWALENTVLITANDYQPNGSNGSGLSEEAYSFDGGETWQKDNAFTYIDNDKYELQVKDNTGKISVQTITISNIDNTPPTIESIKYDDSDVWCESNTLIISANDKQPNGSDGSGLADEPYSFDGGETWQDSDKYIFTDNGTYKIIVKDKTGKESEEEITIKNIDNTSPNVSISKDPESWSKDVTITVAADDKQPNGSDGSGLADEPYSYDGGETWSNDNTYKYSENGTYTVLVKDNLGKITTAQVTIDNIDNTPPEVNHKRSPLLWYKIFNLPSTITLDASDLEAGLDDHPYSYDEGATWVDSPKIKREVAGSFRVLVRDAVGNISTVIIDNDYDTFFEKNDDEKDIKDNKKDTEEKPGNESNADTHSDDSNSPSKSDSSSVTDNTPSNKPSDKESRPNDIPSPGNNNPIDQLKNTVTEITDIVEEVVDNTIDKIKTIILPENIVSNSENEDDDSADDDTYAVSNEEDKSNDSDEIANDTAGESQPKEEKTVYFEQVPTANATVNLTKPAAQISNPFYKTTTFKIAAASTGLAVGIGILFFVFFLLYSGVRLYSKNGKKYKFVHMLTLHHSARGLYANIPVSLCERLYSSKCEIHMGPLFVRLHKNEYIHLKIDNTWIPVPVAKVSPVEIKL